MNNKPLECIVNLQANEYVSLICDDLDKDLITSIEMNKCQLIGVFSPPSTGKTTMINDRAKRNCDIGIYTIVVSPTILLNDKINSVLDGAKNFDGVKFEDATKQIIVATPEGLENVISILEKNNLYFVIEIDEVHERIDSANTRPKFVNIDKALESKYCLLATMYTGTPDAIEKFYPFTKIYRINKKGKAITNNPKIINVDSVTDKSVKDILEYSYLNFRNDKGQIFAFINDKKKHLYLEDNLDTEIFKHDNSSDILYISANTKESSLVREIIRTKKVPEQYRMIIVTSSASTGIEFELNNPATVLAFCNNYTFNIRQEVQSTIRVRTDIDNLIFVKPSDKGNAQSVDYDIFFNEKMNKYIELLNSKIVFWESFKDNAYIKSHGALTKERFLKLMVFANDDEDYEIEEFCSKALVYDAENDTFKIDMALLHKYISDEYADMVLKNTEFFIDTMKKQCSHFDLKKSEFEVLNYNDLFINNHMLEAIQEVLEPLPNNTDNLKENSNEEDTKSIIKNKKDKLKECETSLDNIINIILEEGVAPSRSLHKEAYILLEDLKATDSTYKALEELLIVTTNQEDRRMYIEKYLDCETTTKINSYKKEEIRKTQMPTVYKLVEENNMKEIKKQPSAVKEKCYILKFYKKGTDSRYPYRKVTVNNNTQKELFSYLQTQGLYKDKEFTSTTEKKLLKSLDDLFIFESSKSKSKSKSNSRRISSLRY